MCKPLNQLVIFTAVVACLLLTQSVGHAGTVPDGLAAVSWGATREQVKKIMIGKGFREEQNNDSGNVAPTAEIEVKDVC